MRVGGAKLVDQRRDLHRRGALERHDRQPDDIRLQVLHQPRDGRTDLSLHQDQIGNRDPVMSIDVAGERGERTVRNPDGHRRHVLERIRHRQQEGCSMSVLPDAPV